MINPLKHFGIKRDKYSRSSEDANEFEKEQHADDNLHCKRCGTKIRYSHGDTDLCSACNKEDYELEE